MHNQTCLRARQPATTEAKSESDGVCTVYHIRYHEMPAAHAACTILMAAGVKR